jgi:tight adherence protein B
MVGLHSIARALIGVVATLALARLARRRPVAERLQSDRPRRRLPRRLRARLVTALHDAGVESEPEDAVELWVTASATAALVGIALGAPVGIVSGLGVLVGLPVALVSARSRRSRLMAAAIPDALERVGAELRVGGTVPTALSALAREGGPLAADFGRVESRVGLGASFPAALEAWARERAVVGVEAAAGALALCTSVGGRAAGALDGLASSLRDRLAVAAEVRALSAQARYSAWVIGVAPIGYLLATAAIDPRSVHGLLGTGVGRVCALVGLGLELLGALWMRTILRGGDAW